MGRVIRQNSLSIVMFGLFLAFLAAQSVAGHREYNQEQLDHGEPQVDYVEYLGSGHFVEAVFENWESEFLQMGSFVLFTIFLRQKGSPESKKLEGEEPVDADPRDSRRHKAPWPVRRRGLALGIYEHSLTIVMFLLFFGRSSSTPPEAYPSTTRNSWLTAGKRSLFSPTWVRPASGSSPSRTGRANTWRSVPGRAVDLPSTAGSPESKQVDHPHGETGSE